MKAILHDQYGPPEVLYMAEIATPVPGDDDVLVRVHAAGVDPGVWHLLTGLPYLVRIMGFGLRKPTTRVRGLDVAGRVEAVGRNVAAFRPGDEVFGTCDGSFAEYALSREEKLAPKPASVSYAEAAAIPISALAALHGLRDAGKVQEGQNVLVIGAAGGVGTFGVQIARAMGAHVTGVCSTSKAELVRSLGAEAVIDYTREDITALSGKYDVILDTAGNRRLLHLRRALTSRGTLVIIGGEGGGRWLGGTDRQLRALLLSPFMSHNFRPIFSVETKKDLETLKEMVDAGKVKPVIDTTYTLDRVPDAIRHLARGHTRGKIVITI